MKEVILFGKGELAIWIADWFTESDNYKLKYIIPVIPEPTWCDSILNWAKSKKIPYIESGHYCDIKNVKDEEWKVDLAISCLYSIIIKPWFIKKCKKIINIHPGILPQYRGVNPVNWSLKNKEKFHGVTIHEIDKGIDTGSIISQVKFSIYPETEEVIDVYQRTLKYGWLLFKDTIDRIDKIIPIPQEESLASYNSKKDFENLMERKYFKKEITSEN